LTGDKPEQKELERQMDVATDALRLLQEGEVDPQLVILAAARITGELGASAALADGMDPEAILGDLADFVRKAGREWHDAFGLKAIPAAGNA
jgi:hypothetical protein